MFPYTRCTTPKLVTSLRGPSVRHSARATQLLSKKCRNSGESLTNTVSDLTRPKFEPETSLSRDEALPLYQLAGYQVKFSLWNKLLRILKMHSH